MNLNPDGSVTLCCQSHHAVQDERGTPLNVQTHSLAEIWNASGMRDVRRRMSAGERLPHCEACYSNEAYGRDSYRLASNRRWLKKGFSSAEKIEAAIADKADGQNDLAPLYFDLRLGNLCNLKCTVCKPLYSSQIERDPVHSKWARAGHEAQLDGRFEKGCDWSQSERLLEEIIEASQSVELIQLAGGEPTINRTQMTWLARLQQGGKAPQVDLEVVTNLSNVRPEIYDLFSAFKSLRITLSIDGHGAGYEYVRFPGKWDVLTRNVARLKERCPTAVIVINCVLQALNAHNLVDLFDWADTNDIPIHLSIGRGLEGYNDYRILPATVRQDVRVRFERYFERKANRGLGYQAATVWSALDEIEASAFDEATRRERLGGLLEFISDMDRSRRLSFRADAPDLYAALMRDHTSP